MRTPVKSRTASFVAWLALLLMVAPVSAADDSKAQPGSAQAESGAKQIGRGVEDTAMGVGNAVVGGAESAGEKIKEAGRAAEPE